MPSSFPSFLPQPLLPSLLQLRLPLTMLGYDSEESFLWPALATLLVTIVVGTGIQKLVYNLYFHPLSKYPGPKLAACSNVPFSFWFLGGRQPYKLLELHGKYGHVVRVAPNELSFNSAQSFRDIYGFRPGHKTFIKSEFYDGGSFASRGVHSIVSERDPVAHGQMRRLLAHAFSNSSLKEQEELVAKSVDRFIKLVKAKTDGGQIFDIAKGFERMAFDIIGDLGFGQTFDALDTDEDHPWIGTMLGALTKGALADSFKRFPAVARLLGVVLRRQIALLVEDTRRNEDMAIELVSKRIAQSSNRKDFMTRILEHRKQDRVQVSDLQIAAHASDMVLAGSETTSTALSCATYHLLTSRSVMAKLQSEVRGAFSSYEAISDASTSELPYLQAVCQEAMRVYAPLPLGLPRVVPEGGDVVDGCFLPQGIIVSTNPVAASLDPANFGDPFAFKPERWLDTALVPGVDQLDASQPFILGARGCLGKSLAWTEMRTTLAKLVWAFDLELADVELDWHGQSRMYTLWSKPPLKVRAKLAQP
ncbi:putative cytochrome P450 [Cercophora scortea]|uniref:Cytochrome P450 n=1 Tax=Cercophora scortea TaxID=314031 RepID=A0AAE0IAB9_9PEZI|nr:putative cytochrome P450 [Cercophora scortea]